MTTTKIPVVFRVDKTGQFVGSVTAILPTMKASRGRKVCYAHVEQHSECSRYWYLSTRPASVEEYTPLLRELRAIYDSDDTKLVVRLKVGKW